MIGAIVGAGLGAAGSIYSGIKSAEANKKRRLYLDNYDKESEDYANRWANIDPSQTASAQAGASAMRRLMLENNEALAGQQSVIGGTRASVAAQKAQANDAMAKMASDIAVQGEQRADAVRQQRRQEKQWVEGQRMNMEAQQAAEAAKAGGEVLKAGIGMATADMQSHLDNGKGLFGDGGTRSGSEVQPQSNKPQTVKAGQPSNTSESPIGKVPGLDVAQRYGKAIKYADRTQRAMVYNPMRHLQLGGKF